MAGAALDMTLDDLIKKNQKSGSDGGGGGGRGRGRGSGGPARRLPNRGVNRAAPYASAMAPESVWQRDFFGGDQAMMITGLGGGRVSSIETGTKLYISNLDYGVSNDDIKELFAEVGDLKKSAVHYDKSGRSKGTAEVVYSRQQDALSAVKRYNNVQLDGKPMKIDIVGTNIVPPAVGLPSASFPIGNLIGFPRSGQARGGGFGRPRGGAGVGRGFGRWRGRGRGRDQGEKLSANDLDADLDKYHQTSMQIN